MDPLSLLTLFAPMLVDAGKGLVNRFIAPDVFKPATIDDYVKMKSLDLDMFKAMNDAGGANPSYPWVEAIVRLMRPIVAISVILTWALLHANNMDSPQVDNFCGAIAFYLFGDRTLFYSQQAIAKAK